MIAPGYAELIRRAIESRLADVHVSIPGIVTAYDAATQTASVRCVAQRVLFDDAGEQVPEEPPILENIPVVWPGGGGFYLHFPIEVGDTGQLIFSERSFTEWRETGDVSTPGDLRIHSHAFATFSPGLRSSKAPRGDAPASGVGVIATGDGLLRVGPPEGADFVALSALVDARFAAIHDAIAGLTPAPPNPPDAGEVGLLALQSALADAFASTAATKLKTS